MANVIFENVTKSYGKVQAIKSASFEVKDKEFVVLVGPSGCGKSTLLRMIAGLEDITSGIIKIDNKVVNDLSPKDRDISIVFQNYALYPHMTAYENMAFGLKIRGQKKSEIQQKVMEAAKILDIEDLLKRKPKAMSGGQRQRIAIGRAIVRNPKVFLFDEPLSNLDAQLRSQMRVEIAALHKRLKATMVYVTHDQVEAMTLGDRIVVLDKGIIQQIDSPQQLYNYPENKFVAGFIGSPKMNFIEGKLVGDQENLVFKDVNSTMSINLPMTNRPIKQGKYTLGIRPENIYSSASKSENTVPFKASIQYTELLGHDAFVFFEIGGKTLSARLSAEELRQAPYSMTLYLDIAKAHLFEEPSGIVLNLA